MERTFLMVKPDGVQRRLVGEVIKRIEAAGLKIVALKMIHPSKELIEKSYPDSDEWFKQAGERSIRTHIENNMDIKDTFGTKDAIEIGKKIKEWIVRFMTSSPVVAMVAEGNRAVDNVRRLVGETDPSKALPGTIRGDTSIDNIILGNLSKRPAVNVVHSAGDLEEAENAIKLWFKDEEICEYKMVDEEIFYKKWS